MSVSVTAALNRARTAAERLMVDACLIQHQTGLATDPVTGAVTPAFSTVYAGKCKVQTFTNRELFKEAAEHQFIVQRYEVDVPVSVTGVQANDQITITAAVFDPDLLGRTYRVVGLMNKSMGSARRLGVEESTS